MVAASFRIIEAAAFVRTRIGVRGGKKKGRRRCGTPAVTSESPWREAGGGVLADRW
jgi:hypothetical protein